MRFKLPVIFLLLTGFLFAQSTAGPSSPTAAAQDANGTLLPIWGNLVGIQGSGNGKAFQTVTHNTSGTSNGLYGTGFGFSIPAGATINGITFSFDRLRSATPSFVGNTNAVFLLKAGTVAGSQHGPGSNWTTVSTTETWGSSSDLWGSTWAASDINDPNFGVLVSAAASNSNPAATGTLSVSNYVLTVTYTASVTPAPNPVCTPGTGVYTKAQTVSCSDIAPVMCTSNSTSAGNPATDGMSGCTAGARYTGPIFVPLTQTLYVVAGGTGYLDSSVVGNTYTINAPYAMVSPSALTYAIQTVSTTSSPQSVTLSNVGNTGMLIATIATTGDYAQTNNCPNSSTPLAAGSNCVILVKFTPTTTGDRPGTLVFTDNSTGNVGTTQTVSLDGTGTLTPNPGLKLGHGITIRGGFTFNAFAQSGGGSTPPLFYPSRTDLCENGNAGTPGQIIGGLFGCSGASSGQGSVLKYQKRTTDVPPAAGSVVSGVNLFGLNSYLNGVNSAAMPAIDTDMGGQIYRATDASMQASVKCLGGGNFGSHFNMGSNGNPRRFNADDTKLIVTNSGGNQNLMSFNPINGQVVPSSICGGYLPGPATFDGADPNAFYTINNDQENTVPFTNLAGNFITPETVTQDTTAATAQILSINSNMAQFGKVTGTADNTHTWRDSGGASFAPNASYAAPATGSSTPYAVTIYRGIYCDGNLSAVEQSVCIQNPNPVPTPGPACAANDLRPACWYALMSLEYELTYVAALVGYEDNAAVIRFPAASGNCLPANYNANYTGEFNTGDSGDTMSVVVGDNGQSNHTGQSGYTPPAGASCPNSPSGVCTGPVYDVAYRRANGCRVFNTITDLISGDWGPTGQAVNGQANIVTISSFTGSPAPGDVLIQDTTLAGTTLTCEQNSSGLCTPTSANWTQFQTGLIYGTADSNSAHKWRDCGVSGTSCGSTGTTNFFTPSAAPVNAPFIFPDVTHDMGQKADDLVSSPSMVQQNAMQCSNVSYSHTTLQTTCTFSTKTQFSPGQQFVFTGLVGANDQYLNCVSANVCPIMTLAAGGANPTGCALPLCGIAIVTDTINPVPGSDYSDAENGTNCGGKGQPPCSLLGSWGQDGIGGVHAGFAGNNFWQNRTLILNPDLGATGHSASGFAFDYQGKQYTALNDLNPTAPATSTGQPDGSSCFLSPFPCGYASPLGGAFNLQLLPTTIVDDQHGFNRNHGNNDQPPVGFSAELTCGLSGGGVGNIPCTPAASIWDSELIAVENWVTRSSPGNLVGADCNYGAGPTPCVYRLGISYCTNSNWNFSVQNCIANISPDGQFVVWGSDWNNTLGCMDLVSTVCISSWQATSPNASQGSTAWSIDGSGLVTITMSNSFCPPGGTQFYASDTLQAFPQTCGTAPAQVTTSGFTAATFLNGTFILGGNPVSWTCAAGICTKFQGTISSVTCPGAHCSVSGVEVGGTQKAVPQTCNTGSLCARGDVFIKRLSTTHQ